MKQLLFTKGPQGPIGATLGTAMNNFCSSSNKVSTHYITWLFSFWIWRRRCLKFAWFWPFGALPLGPHGGHTYYLNNFESPTPKDDSCHFWLKSNHAFSKRRWKSYFLQRAHRGPLGPPWELPWTTFVLHLCIYTLHNLTILLLDLEKKMFEICMVLALWGPPPGGHTYYLNNFESPTPKDDSCQVWLKSNHAFSRRR